MKKILFSAVLLIVMTMSVAVVSAKAIFDISAPDGIIKAGDEFEASVTLSNSPEFSAIEFLLMYDSLKLECINIEEGELLSGAITATNPKADGGALLGAASLNPIEGSGVVARYTFKAKTDMDEPDFKLKNILLSDAHYNAVEYEVANNNEADINENSGVSGGVNGATDSDKEIETQFSHGFSDVIGHWAEGYIDKASEMGLFVGDTNGNFNPDDNVTRAQFITVIWKMAGKPIVDTKTPFADIETEPVEFKNAIMWGYANGHIKGTSETTFNPKAPLTREAGMKILHSYSGGNVGDELLFYSIYDGTFSDSADISSWAKSSLYWGVYNKMLSGTSPDTLSPKGTATRAQLARILVDYTNIN